MITKADIEKRIEELRVEGAIQVAKTEGMYLGAISENERLLSSFDSPDNSNNKEIKKNGK